MYSIVYLYMMYYLLNNILFIIYSSIYSCAAVLLNQGEADVDMIEIVMKFVVSNTL